jgi:serine protease Do
LSASALAAGAVITGLAFAGVGAPERAVAQLKSDSPSVMTPMGRAPLSFADIVDRVKPSVVSISVRSATDPASPKSAPKGGNRPRGNDGIPGFPNIPEDHPLYDFFKNFKGPQGPQQQRQSQGSGFVISADGFIVTNNHVVDGSGKITVTFDEKTKYDAQLIGTDQRTDLALLKIKADKPLPFVKFAPKDSRVGDWVLAVGNPFGLGGTVTAGIVSALSRDIGNGPYDFMQIDAAVNKGNSGGPTFNLDGEVVGVNTAIYSPSGGNVGIAFAVPAHRAAKTIEELKLKGSVSRGWLGVKIEDIDEDKAAALGLAENAGALVNEVTVGGPALASGIKVGDAITAVNGSKIADSRDLARRIAEFTPGTMVDVRVMRNGRDQSIAVKLGTFPTKPEEVAKLDNNGKPSATTGTELTSLGLTMAPKDAAGAPKEGVAISDVAEASDAAAKGLKAGDVILEVNSQKVATAADIEGVIKEAQKNGRKAVLLNVKSGDARRILAVQIKAQG